MKYCSKCGRELMDEAVICPGCGCEVEGARRGVNVPRYTKDDYEDARAILQQKMKTVRWFWTILGSIQTLAGVPLLIISFVILVDEAFDIEAHPFFLASLSVLVVGIINLKFANTYKKLMEAFERRPVGIQEYYDNALGRIVGGLIFNLFFGGLIGIIGSILEFSARNYVLNNRRLFREIEEDYRLYMQRPTATASSR